MKDYNYYKKKYHKITIQLDREKDADIIEFLTRFRSSRGVKTVICERIRELIKVWDGDKNENLQA